MPRAQWPFRGSRPAIEIICEVRPTGKKASLALLADTGAGKAHDIFELVLRDADCRAFGGRTSYRVWLGGAYHGSFPIYLVPIEIPVLGYTADVRAVGVPVVPRDFDGIAAFRFLNRFTYGNFGNASIFGLEL